MIFFRLMYTSNVAIKLLGPFFTSHMMVLAPLNFYNSNMSASFVNRILIWYLFRSPNNICFAYLWYLSQHTVVSLFVYVFLEGGKDHFSYLVPDTHTKNGKIMRKNVAQITTLDYCTFGILWLIAPS